ncbi:MAG: hypothetical protein NZU63_12300 [Gemmataceae bacterium]|nr:hypothetical protein [Gemmataceae bacterium]
MNPGAGQYCDLAKGVVDVAFDHFHRLVNDDRHIEVDIPQNVQALVEFAIVVTAAVAEHQTIPVGRITNNVTATYSLPVSPPPMSGSDAPNVAVYLQPPTPATIPELGRAACA